MGGRFGDKGRVAVVFALLLAACGPAQAGGDGSKGGSGKTVYVHSYTKKDGTVVAAYYRSAPNSGYRTTAPSGPPMTARTLPPTSGTAAAPTASPGSPPAEPTPAPAPNSTTAERVEKPAPDFLEGKPRKLLRHRNKGSILVLAADFQVMQAYPFAAKNQLDDWAGEGKLLTSAEPFEVVKLNEVGELTYIRLAEGQHRGKAFVVRTRDAVLEAKK